MWGIAVGSHHILSIRPAFTRTTNALPNDFMMLASILASLALLTSTLAAPIADVRESFVLLASTTKSKTTTDVRSLYLLGPHQSKFHLSAGNSANLFSLTTYVASFILA
jgi:hypothetical protein